MATDQSAARAHIAANGQNPSKSAMVYVDGVFDLFHSGHISFLKKAKHLGGEGARLIVGVITDEDAMWKRKPIMSHEERLTLVRHCVLVDKVVEAPPLVITDEFLDEYGIDYVVHGDDATQEEFFRVPIRRQIMVYIPYTPGVSTSNLIERIKATAAPTQANADIPTMSESPLHGTRDVPNGVGDGELG